MGVTMVNLVFFLGGLIALAGLFLMIRALYLVPIIGMDTGETWFYIVASLLGFAMFLGGIYLTRDVSRKH
jgi:hypothetical protein